MSTPQIEFGKRLCLAIERAGYKVKPAVVAREFSLRHLGGGVSLHGARRWLKGETIPTFDKVEVLADWLQVSIHELLYGKTDVRRAESELQALADAGVYERATIEAFLALAPEHRKTVREVILAFSKAGSL